MGGYTKVSCSVFCFFLWYLKLVCNVDKLDKLVAYQKCSKVRWVGILFLAEMSLVVTLMRGVSTVSNVESLGRKFKSREFKTGIGNNKFLWWKFLYIRMTKCIDYMVVQ